MTVIHRVLAHLGPRGTMIAATVPVWVLLGVGTFILTG